VRVQVVGHAARHVVAGGLRGAVRHALVVALRGPVGDVDDQAGALGDHHRRREDAGNVVRSAAGIEHLIPAGERGVPEPLLVPELRAVVEVLVAAPDVVDQDVESALLPLDSLEDGLHLRIVAVVAADRDALPAEIGHLLRRLVDRAGQRNGGVPLLYRPARDVDRGACFAQTQRDALAHPATRPRNQRHLS